MLKEKKWVLFPFSSTAQEKKRAGEGCRSCLAEGGKKGEGEASFLSFLFSGEEEGNGRI